MATHGFLQFINDHHSYALVARLENDMLVAGYSEKGSAKDCDIQGKGFIHSFKKIEILQPKENSLEK